MEIKWAGEPFTGYVDPILSIVQKSNCIIGCMVPEVVQYAKKDGGQTAGIAQSYTHHEKFIFLQPDVLALSQHLITPELIDRLHERGIEAWGWTIDDVSIAKKFESMGLDGLITNNVRGIKTCR